MYSNKTTKRVIAMLLIALLLMTIGFAVEQQQLNITGTSKIDSRWDVRITGITSTPTGKAENATDPAFTNTTASFKVNLTDPGDTMVYNITVKNNGTMDAVLSNITKTDSNNPAISFTYSGIETNSILRAGKSATLKVTVKFNDVAVDSSNMSSTLTLTMNYKQNNPNNTDYVVASKASEYILNNASLSVTSGLEADSYEEGNYIYRGADPENYITFNNEEAGWRILSIESDKTIKIVKDSSIENIAWDTAANRDSSTSTYCTNASSNGCNVWTATFVSPGFSFGGGDGSGSGITNFTQYSPNGNKTSDTTNYSGYITGDASLNTYLNTTYYNSLTEVAKSQIVSHDFYVSTPGNSSDIEGIATDSQQIKNYIWNGKIALMTIIEYMKASTDATCSNLKNAYGSSNVANCSTTNWLKTRITEWTLSPYVSEGRSEIWKIYGDSRFSFGGGGTSYSNTTDENGVRPALYLSSETELTGTGTVDDPYRIVS